MANEEQVAILRQGVATWNKWREENPDVEIDLSGVKLDRLDLRGVNFRKANFCNQILYIQNEWELTRPTDFSYSDLTDAIFDYSTLSDRGTLLYGAKIDGTSWLGVKNLCLSEGNAILKNHVVCELLVNGNAKGLYPFLLKGINLRNTYLVDFDLREVNLRESVLICANLSGADITGAKLWGSARENWIIDGIRCKYVYWDEAGEQRTPPDRNFRPGEFEELYKQLPTFEYIFEQGFTPLDPLIMDRVVQAVNERHKEFSLELVNFDKRGQPHATFTVCHLEHVEKAKQQIAAGYEENRIAPERQEPYMQIISRLLDQNDKSLDIIKQFGGAAMRDKYSITVSNGGQVGGIGDHATVSGNTFQQITADLSRLHEEMQRSAKTPEQRAAAEDVAKATQAAREQNEPAMRQHLKNAGKFVLDCTQKIGAEALAEYLKKITLGL